MERRGILPASARWKEEVLEVDHVEEVVAVVVVVVDQVEDRVTTAVNLDTYREIVRRSAPLDRLARAAVVRAEARATSVARRDTCLVIVLRR